MIEETALNHAPDAAASLVEVRRGALIESCHRGHIAAVTPDGELVASLGAPETLTYLRSSAKPHQAITLVASGAADRFGFTPEEIALACGSHSGEAIHTLTARRMLDKIGLTSDKLKCGAHEPFSREVARELRRTNREPDVLQNNCSGKHAGMLALALHLNASVDDYDSIDSPVQQSILHTVAEFAGVRPDEVEIGTDGCGVPVFGVSVRRMALMYARLVAARESNAFADEATKRACERVVCAMIAHPEMVGGTTDRLDTELMRASGGRLVSKVGAEGVYTVGVLPSEKYPRGLGFALKIEDGEDRRARPVVVIEALHQLGALDPAARAAVAPYASFKIHNHRGDEVGIVTPRFTLDSVGAKHESKTNRSTEVGTE